MKIAHSPFHLTYCTNIHPGESWAAVWQNLQTYLPALKQQLSPDVPFGIGLRLADAASRELLQGEHLAQLRAWLDQQGLYVFTLNGFPYGGFHRQVVKDQVYSPDWFTRDRLAYTQRLIKILAALLPDNLEGSISTLPISYKPWWSDPAQLEQNHQRAARQLAILAGELSDLYATTGQKIHLGLEPEPDGLIENSTEVIDWFDRYLLPLGTAQLQSSHGGSAVAATQILRRHIQVCYDTCHFAVEFEAPIAAIERLTHHGIGLSKVQLSSAIQFDIPAAVTDRQKLQAQLAPFAESTYLHQVIARHPSGRLERFRDLAQALPSLLDTAAAQWRTHFHVPLFVRDYPAMSSTQADIQAVLNYLKQNPVCQHLEIETYTWEVLPSAMKLDIATSIRREYDWVLAQMQAPIAKLPVVKPVVEPSPKLMKSLQTAWVDPSAVSAVPVESAASGTVSAMNSVAGEVAADDISPVSENCTQSVASSLNQRPRPRLATSLKHDSSLFSLY